MASQPERIASLETTASIAKWVLGIFIPLVIVWGAFVTMNVIAMKQQLADGGNTKLVTELKSPKSPDQLQANLSTVVAQIQMARVEGKPPDEKKVAALSGALAKVVQDSPSLPEVWQAAAQLVDYKFQPKQTDESLPNCLDMVPPEAPEVDRIQTPDGAVDYPNFSGPQTQGWMAHIYLGKCVLDLDDEGDFDNTSVGKYFQRVRKHHPQAAIFIIVVQDAVIKYSGGKMLPVSAIQFANCAFEIVPPVSLPSNNTKQLIAQLLPQKISTGEVQFNTSISPATHS